MTSHKWYFLGHSPFWTDAEMYWCSRCGTIRENGDTSPKKRYFQIGEDTDPTNHKVGSNFEPPCVQETHGIKFITSATHEEENPMLAAALDDIADCHCGHSYKDHLFKPFSSIYAGCTCKFCPCSSYNPVGYIPQK